MICKTNRRDITLDKIKSSQIWIRAVSQSVSQWTGATLTSRHKALPGWIHLVRNIKKRRRVKIAQVMILHDMIDFA